MLLFGFMKIVTGEMAVHTRGKGTYEITAEVERLVREDDPDFIHTQEGPDWKLPLLPANQHGRTRISPGCRFFMGI